MSKGSNSQNKPSGNKQDTKGQMAPTNELKGVQDGGSQEVLNPVVKAETKVIPEQGAGAALETKAEVAVEEVKEYTPETDTGKAVLAYAKAMGKNVPVTREQIIGHQSDLYQAISYMMRQKQEDFGPLLKDALMVVETYPSAFDDKLLFRRFDSVRIPAKKRPAYEDLIVFLVTVAPRQTRSTMMKQFDLTALTRAMDPVPAQNLLGYFGNV